MTRCFMHSCNNNLTFQYTLNNIAHGNTLGHVKGQTLKIKPSNFARRAPVSTETRTVNSALCTLNELGTPKFVLCVLMVEVARRDMEKSPKCIFGVF